MPRFVVQKHRATKLHYDFRLEMSGVLKSWAVPKIPPRAIGLKRLAVQVADHALSYANFEGIIEEGYGKGTVEIWDKGTYKLESKKPGKIIFELNGGKLKGRYCLVKFAKAGPKNWLFFKIKKN
ncbi:MAG: DNA polymerase ligase N-terminal domain-containing protein [archaeon]